SFYVFPFVLFFFSSRRRHTRSKRDWSSDVCSSDLIHHHWSDVIVGISAASCAVHAIALFSMRTSWLVVAGSGSHGSWRRVAETVRRDRHQDSGKPHVGRGHDGPDWNDGSDESRRICEHCSTSSGSSSADSGSPWDTGPPASSAAFSSSPSPGAPLPSESATTHCGRSDARS